MTSFVHAPEIRRYFQCKPKTDDLPRYILWFESIKNKAVAFEKLFLPSTLVTVYLKKVFAICLGINYRASKIARADF